MSGTLELAVPGDAAACRRAADAATTAAAAVATAADRTTSAMTGVGAAWTGDAADAFDQQLRDTRKDLDALHDRLTAVASALTTFADSLGVAQRDMHTARTVALGGGLSVAGDTVHSPARPAGDATDAQRADHDAKVKAWNAAVDHAGDARTKETAAHTELEESLQKAVGDGWLEHLLQGLGFEPASNLGVPGEVLWGAGTLGTVTANAASWMIKGRYGTFQPRVSGRFASPAAFSRWQRALMSGDDANWHALPNAAGARGAWSTAGRWAGRAGVAVSFGTAAWGQWESDADDPALDTTAKVSRSVTVGAATAAGAWAGAEGGAWVGGAIGTAICPGVGTVVGGAVGALVGGFAGSTLGGAVGDALKDGAGKVGDAVGDFVGDVGGDIGHALTFW